MTTRGLPLLVLVESVTPTHRAVERFHHEVIGQAGTWAVAGKTFGSILAQVVAMTPATHVLILAGRDIPTESTLERMTAFALREPFADVLYGNKVAATPDLLKSSRRVHEETDSLLRLAEWSPHRLQFENCVGNSFLVRVPFLLSVLAALEPDEEWDAWQFLIRAVEHEGAGMRDEEPWFWVLDLAQTPPIRSIEKFATPAVIPRASLITLTAGTQDKGRPHPTLVDEHLDTIAASSAGMAQHIVVVGPECPAPVLASLARRAPHDIEVLSRTDSFNFSRRCNDARACATGEFIVLLNDDFVPMREDWLDLLLEPFIDPNVGITGATLLYDDNTVQHIGVGVVHSNFTHSYRGEPLSEPRVSELVKMNREVDAVTGACLAIRAHLYDYVGGLTEGFPLNYNDVDLCLKVRSLGRSIIHVGTPLGYHLESKTRPAVVLPEEVMLLNARWPGRKFVAAFPFENYA